MSKFIDRLLIGLAVFGGTEAHLVVRRFWVTKWVTGPGVKNGARGELVHASYDTRKHLHPDIRRKAWTWKDGNAGNGAFFRFSFLIGVRFGNRIGACEDDVMAWDPVNGWSVDKGCSAHLSVLMLQVEDGQRREMQGTLREIAIEDGTPDEGELFSVPVAEEPDEMPAGPEAGFEWFE